ncbi:hypothetical protein WCO32_05935 [Enterobacter hormaechei]|uniref:hypothetical protein n=1 Tax=Enterobacter hormaechei TaxID=158836 RepID=UPI0030D1E043
MAQLLIFADDEPAKLLKIRSYRSKILYLYANDEVRCLDVVIFFFNFSERRKWSHIGGSRQIREQERNYRGL